MAPLVPLIATMKILVLFALIGISVAAVDYTGHQVYRSYPTPGENELLQRFGKVFELDFWSDYRHGDDFVDFRVSPELRSKVNEFLTKNRINYEIFIEDLGIAIAKERKPKLSKMNDDSFDYFVYHTVDEIDEWITSFTKDNSFASVVTIGSGKSYEGRNMRGLKISTGSDRPAFVINCGIHAREWITPATCLYTANKLMNEYNMNMTITHLMNGVDFYLIPSSNPDGYAYTWSNDRMWRKTRSKSDMCDTCIGVDPNRNWDFHWGEAGSSSDCCSESYKGSVAFSEIETKNQRDFVESIENVRAYIDVHSYSQTWMYPYGYTKSPAPDAAILEKIGRDSVSAISSVDSHVFQTGSISDVVYVASGSTADFFYSKGIKCSWGAELRDTGKYGFILPEDQIGKGAEEAFQGLCYCEEHTLGPC
uniref:carboxypeptidase B-like n=1 Tax=Styela clava TaxID=7725 RepID=UPI00193A673D|nr:carboxypeptidase B-like [Styela clava]